MKKKLIALALSLTLVMGLATTALAAESPAKGPTPPSKPVAGTATVNGEAVVTSADGTATVTAAPNNKKTTIASTVVVNGVTYNVTTVAANAVGGKTQKVTLAPGVTRISNKAFAKAKKLKTIKFNCKPGTKASDYSIGKKAFKGRNTRKMTIKVNSNMSKKQFKKLVKKLRNAGFKGKISRV